VLPDDTHWSGARPFEEQVNVPDYDQFMREEKHLRVYPNVLTSHSCAPAASGRFIYGLYGFKIGIQGYNPWHHAN